MCGAFVWNIVDGMWRREGKRKAGRIKIVSGTAGDAGKGAGYAGR